MTTKVLASPSDGEDTTYSTLGRTAPGANESRSISLPQRPDDAASCSEAPDAAQRSVEATEGQSSLTDEGDLNAVSDADLIAAKAAMEVTFQRSALRPGDPGYVHDKRVDAPAQVRVSAPLPRPFASPLCLAHLVPPFPDRMYIGRARARLLLTRARCVRTARG